MKSKQIKFYDYTLYLMVLCLVLFFISESLALISLIVGLVSLVIFNFGMVYNAYKRKNFWWAFAILLGGIIVSLTYYFRKIRKIEGS